MTRHAQTRDPLYLFSVFCMVVFEYKIGLNLNLSCPSHALLLVLIGLKSD